MPLPDTAHSSPHRAYGMDQDRYAWEPAPVRQPFAWPGDKALALMIVVPLERHGLNPSGKPFKHPGAMQTPYPDLRHYTTRDYGNRVGVFRILEALKAASVTATFPINASLLARAPPLIDAILADGHEIAAYGLDTDAIHWGAIAPETEKSYIEQTRAAFNARGLSPITWMSPARQQSFATPDLIRAAGFTVCLDWEMDSVPRALRTDHGALNCVPLYNELDDRKLLIDQRQTEAEWRDQILEAAAMMKAEHAARGGQVLSFSLTPYVSGQPFRIWALRETLSALSGDSAIWCAGASSIAQAAP